MTGALAAKQQLDDQNPWPGLESFEENDDAFFYGRHHEAESLLSHVLDAPVTVLYGRSGLGKTSLLQAGLFPLLRDRHFLPVYVRFDLKPGAAPLSRQLHQSVHDSIRADVPDAMLPLDEESLWEYLHRADFELWNAQNYLLTPVIVLDQFEELFTLGEQVPDLVRVFRNDLGDLIENRIPADLAARIEADEAVAARFHLRSQNYKLLISLREDFLPELEGWRRLIPALGRSRIRLLPMRALDAVDAVHKPAAHLMMTDALARQVVGIIAGKDLHRDRDTAWDNVDHPGDDLGALDVEPALLSLFCQQLNEERKHRGQPHFDEQLVEDAKGDVLSKYYLSCVSDLPPRVAHFIESKLITKNGFRDSCARVEAVPSHLTDDELTQLIRSRLLRLEERYGAQQIELTHDVLTGVVREHRDRRRAEDEKAALAAQAEKRARIAEDELRTAALIKRSRILRVLLTGTAVIAALAIVASVVAITQRSEALTQRSAAQVRFRDAIGLRLVSEAQAMLNNARSGGDVRAFQQLLAARSLTTTPDDGALYSAVVKKITTRKIVDTPEAPTSVALSPDGHRIASASADAVQLWNADTGQPIGRPIGPQQGVTAVALSPGGRRLAISDNSGTVELWNADTGQPIGRPIGPQQGVTAVALSADGRRFVVAHSDQTISLWDVDSGQPIGGPTIRSADAVTSVAVSVDGHLLATGDKSGTVQLVSADTGKPIGDPLTGHTDAVTGVAFSLNGLVLAAGSADDTIRLWDVGTRQPIGDPLTGHTNVVTGVALSGDGQLVSGSADKTIRLWDPALGQPLTGHTDVVTSVAFGADGHAIASGSLDDTIRLWDNGTRALIGAPVIAGQGGVTSVTFGYPHRIASGGLDGTVRFFDADTRQPIGSFLSGYGGAINSVASSRDGHRIVSGSDDKTVRLWNADTGQPLGAPLTGHTAAVESVAFSPDGQRIASGSLDGTIRLWNADTGNPIAVLTGHTDEVISVAFSPDNQRLASASWDRTIRLWDLDTGRQIGTPLSASDLGPVESVAFSPDGRHLASGSANGTIRLWDVHTTPARQIGDPLTGHREAVDGLAFSPDNQRLASASADHTIRLWPTVATPADLCDKLTTNMSRKQWRDWVSPDIEYLAACPGVPIAPD